MSARSPHDTPKIVLTKMKRDLSDIMMKFMMRLLIVLQSGTEDGPRQWATKIREHYEASLKEFNFQVSGAILKATDSIDQILKRYKLHHQTAKFRSCEGTASHVMRVYMQSFYNSLTKFAQRLLRTGASHLESSYDQELPGQCLTYDAVCKSHLLMKAEMECEFSWCFSRLQEELRYVIGRAQSSKIAKCLVHMGNFTKEALTVVKEMMISKIAGPDSALYTAEGKNRHWTDDVDFSMLLLRQKYAAAINKANKKVLRLLAPQQIHWSSQYTEDLNARLNKIFQDLHHSLEGTVDGAERRICDILDDIYRGKRVMEDQKLQEVIVHEVTKEDPADLCVGVRGRFDDLLMEFVVIYNV